MSKVQMLRALVKQRLTAAAEEIFGLFERTIAEYEEELSRSKEENERQRKLLESVFNPELRFHRADVQQLLVVKVEVPSEQQEWSSSLVQEDPEPPHIKEDREEHWTSQEGEQLQRLEETDPKFPFTPVLVKSDEDEEKPESSHLHHTQTEQMETEADGEDCRGPEPAWNSDPNRHPEPDAVYKTGDSSEPETDDSDDWKETREPQSGLKSLNIDDTPVSDSRCGADVQQLLVVKVEVPSEQQEWSSSLVQGDPEPPRIKEDQEEHWTSQEGEQLQRLEEADPKFPFTPVPVKSGEDEEKPQSSHLHHTQTEQMETEADGEDCGGSEPARDSDPDRHHEPDTVYKTGDSSEPETDDSYDWKETREPRSGFKSLNIDDVPVSDFRCGAGEKPFSCSECGQRFGKKGNLKINMRSHPGEKPFSCVACKKCLMHRGNLEKHTRIHTREKPLSCLVCNKSFIDSGDLKTHMSSHSEQKPFSCSVCKKSLTHSGDLKNHMRSNTGAETFRASSQQVIEQMETEADGEDYVGPARNSDPGKHPDDGDDLKEIHMRSHTGDKPLSCSVCKKAFIQSGHLKRHMRIHTGEKPFSCSVCKKAFIQSGHLKRHMRSHTGEKPFSCSVCKKAFIQSGNLKIHMRIHTVEKPFSCSVCEKSFISSGHLKTHMRCHTGDKTFSCSVCKKSFIRGGDLKIHMRIHTGEKPFSCSVCKKSFISSGHLKTHMRFHTGDKTFSCSVCKKAFILNGDLKIHMRIHTGEKPFSCSVCKKSFIRGGDLKIHMRFHTGEKPFSCSVCKKAFTQRRTLQKHMKVHTREKQPDLLGSSSQLLD